MTEVSTNGKQVGAEKEKPQRARTGAAKAGVGFGSALAITISWSVHESILLAIFHGILGWLYVLYYAVTRW